LREYAVENFYGFAHGNLFRFADIPSSVFAYYLEPKRFRFVFLDGCRTGQSGSLLLSYFGASSSELGSGRTIEELRQANPNDPLTGPVLFEQYGAPNEQFPGRLGIRPGVFLGWRYDTHPGRPFVEGEPYYGIYDGYLDPAIAHWEQMVVYYWLNGRTMLGALERASQDAVDPGAWPPWEMNFPVVTKSDGSTVLFFPNTCLNIFGCGELGFNQLNHAGDSW